MGPAPFVARVEGRRQARTQYRSLAAPLRSVLAALAATVPVFAAGHAAGDPVCLVTTDPTTVRSAGDPDVCERPFAPARDRPRRTEGLTAVIFTSEVWPEATFETALHADTYAAPGDYALAVGQLRVTARPTADASRVSAAVEVTNLTTCLLLLDLRFYDDGDSVTQRWLMRVRARRAGLAAEPVVIELPDVRLRTPLAERTATNAFAAEFRARFVECGRLPRQRLV